ncbi:MAG: glycosyltransferase [Verrucomicrobiota bacterium]|nr:glycosyltransferase [Verrucomicrobiota bacterium]
MNGISAYIPCYNNALSLSKAIESMRKQTVQVDELFVIDDGSTDDSLAIAAKHQVKVVSLGKNFGRGRVRAEAVERSMNPFVLSCDATNALEPDFLEKALPHFDVSATAAVFGRIRQMPGGNFIQRWRGRHLFQEEIAASLEKKALLSTWGCVLRREAALKVGNFNPNLRHSEDADLGERLLKQGYEVVFDPRLNVFSVVENSLGQVLERYWRWYAGKNENLSIRSYLKQIVFSIKVLAVRDWRAGDPGASFVSLLVPHYQFWKTLIRKSRKHGNYNR